MNLTRIEKERFEEFSTKINKKINDSKLELFDSFYKEDCDFRMEIINEIIDLLKDEEELIVKLLSEEE